MNIEKFTEGTKTITGAKSPVLYLSSRFSGALKRIFRRFGFVKFDFPYRLILYLPKPTSESSSLQAKTVLQTLVPTDIVLLNCILFYFSL